MPAGKRTDARAVHRPARDPFGPVRLWVRSLRSLVGRNETLGVERVLARAVLYRAPGRGQEPAASPDRRTGTAASNPGRDAKDTGRGGRSGPDDPARSSLSAASVETRRPDRINLLIPTIDLEHLFGGYIAKFNLARKLAEAGHRVRIVTVDPNRRRCRRTGAARSRPTAGSQGVFDAVEVAFARDGPALLEVNPRRPFRRDDVVDRTHRRTRWSARPTHDRFLYLIQEYEPLTVPPGILGSARPGSPTTSRTTPCSRPSSSATTSANAGTGSSPRNAGRRAVRLRSRTRSPRSSPPSADELANRDERRLLFYARPEAHAHATCSSSA